MSGVLQALLASSAATGNTTESPRAFEPAGTLSGSGSTVTIPSFEEENACVLLTMSVRGTSNLNLSATGWTELADVYANSTYDANLAVFYKLYPTGLGSPEGVTLSHSAYWSLHFFTGVDVADIKVATVSTTAVDAPIVINTAELEGRQPYFAAVAGASSVAGSTGPYIDLYVPEWADGSNEGNAQPLAVERVIGSPSTAHILHTCALSLNKPLYLTPIAPLNEYMAGLGEYFSATISSCGIAVSLGPQAEPADVPRMVQDWSTFTPTTSINTYLGPSAKWRLAILAYANASTSDNALSVVSEGWTQIADLYADDTYDCNLGVSYKLFPPEYDTLVDISLSHACIPHLVFIENIDHTDPFYTTATTATGINSPTPTPPSISEPGSGVICSIVASHSGVTESKLRNDDAYVLSGSYYRTGISVAMAFNYAKDMLPHFTEWQRESSAPASCSWAAVTVGIR